MNILVTVDSNYIRPLKVMLTSFFTYHKTKNKIYLFYSSVREEELQEINILIEGNGSIFIPIKLQDDLFCDIPVLRYFTKEMYYRLLAGRLIAEEERVLYLDPDLLVRGSLDELYQTDLAGKVLAGVEDYAVKTLLSAHKAEVGFSQAEIYINSGVLLMDLEAMRQNLREEEIDQIAKEMGDQLQYPDQDMINLIFRGKIRFLDRRYNYNTGYGSGAEAVKYLLGGFWKEKKYPVIVHYMGASKPWKPGYYGKFGREYRRYLTPFLNLQEKKEWNRHYVLIVQHLFRVLIRKIGGEK